MCFEYWVEQITRSGAVGCDLGCVMVSEKKMDVSSVSEQTRTEVLSELRLITKHDAESRPLIADAGAVPFAAATLLNLFISCRYSLVSMRGYHRSSSSLVAALHNLLAAAKDYRPHEINSFKEHKKMKSRKRSKLFDQNHSPDTNFASSPFCVDSQAGSKLALMSMRAPSSELPRSHFEISMKMRNEKRNTEDLKRVLI